MRSVRSDGTGSGFWERYLLVLALLLPVDYAITKLAVSIYGPRVEVNPVMRWLLRQPLGIEIALQVGVLFVAVFGFAIILEAIQGTAGRLPAVVDLWLWLWLLGGTLICLSNLGFLLMAAIRNAV